MSIRNAENSPYVSRAGGQFEIDHNGAHVYVVWWPEWSILKVGISETARWFAWQGTGAVEYAVLATCCMDDAKALERWLLDSLAAEFRRAFTTKDASRPYLGRKGAGWTECFRVREVPHWFDRALADLKFLFAHQPRVEASK